MWHDARRREKANQKLLTDHKKRADKRREENRVDPISLLQVHGIGSKVHLDYNKHTQASRALVVWQGDQKTTIDRFDVRATLSSLPRAEKLRSGKQAEPRSKSTVLDAGESDSMKKLLNFERYRLLIQNDLYKVPEIERLRMVGRSGQLSGAKMKKLENNWFGTSGETSLPRASQVKGPSQPQPRSQGVAIGFDYNQSQQGTDQGADGVGFDESVARSVMDASEFDDLDLDCVDRTRTGCGQMDELISRYGLSCDEFNLLIDSDQNASSFKETTNQLKQLKARKLAESAETKEQSLSSEVSVYGPTSPLKKLTDYNDNEPPLEESQSSYSPPVHQRSPSGAGIPLRTADKTDRLGAESVAASGNNGNVASVSSSRSNHSAAAGDLSKSNPKSGPTRVEGEQMRRHIDQVAADNGSSSSQAVPLQTDRTGGPDHDDAHRTRRASTPLAYKRYRRSSRSLSRDRRSTRPTESRSLRHDRRPRSRRRRRSRSQSVVSSISCSSRWDGSCLDSHSSHYSSSRSSASSSSRGHRRYRSSRHRRHRSRSMTPPRIGRRRRRGRRRNNSFKPRRR